MAPFGPRVPAEGGFPAANGPETMAEDVLIRDVRPDDVETLVEIAVAAWAPINAERLRFMGEELFGILHSGWQERKARQVRAACAPGSRAGVCVAEIDGRAVGFATYWTDDATGIGELSNNAVHADVRGRGLGGRMYEYVFERLRERGMRFVVVRTGGDAGHAPARRAYEKAGFDVQDPKMVYYRRL